MQAEQSTLDRIERKLLKWYGHLLRMAGEDLPVDTARKEEKRKTARVMVEPSDICIILHYNMYYFHFTLQELS